MINLKENTTQPEELYPLKKRPKKSLFFKLGVYLVIFLIIGLATFSSQTSTSNENGSWLNKIPIIGQFKQLVESADKDLKGEERDRVNILLLGMGGKKHEGGYLTDTIILAGLEPSSQKVALLSIPRDLTVPLENLGWKKINTINAYAETENPDSGGLAVSQALADVLDIPIDYYVRLDFEGFINIVNELGGVEIEVENTIDDQSYPVLGNEQAEPYESRFEYLHIEKGGQKMDGELALKYARSRHSSGVEGSDFARARRQQKIIMAVKDKILSKYTLFKPQLIANLINEYQAHVSTNLKLWEIIKLWSLFKDTSKENIINRVLDNSQNGLLTDMIAADGAYILTPRSGDFAEIQYLIHNIFYNVPIEAKAKVTVEDASVEVRNGTWINGLANQVALDLERYGFNIIRVGNTSRQNFQKSVVYDLTLGEKMKSLAILKDKTYADISYDLPQWLMDDISQDIADEENPEQPDFILILGQAADTTGSGVENKEE